LVLWCCNLPLADSNQQSAAVSGSQSAFSRQQPAAAICGLRNAVCEVQGFDAMELWCCGQPSAVSRGVQSAFSRQQPAAVSGSRFAICGLRPAACGL